MLAQRTYFKMMPNVVGANFTPISGTLLLESKRERERENERERETERQRDRERERERERGREGEREGEGERGGGRERGHPVQACYCRARAWLPTLKTRGSQRTSG